MGLSQAAISAKADIWSLGITVLELAFGKPPHANADPTTLRQILSTSPSPTAALYDDSSYSFSSAFHQFIAQCLIKEPRTRCSAATLLKHRFMKKAKRDNTYMRNVVADLMKKRHEIRIAEQRLRKDQARKERNDRKRSDVPGIMFT
jgi:serine/threonine-protein kinase 24/25/MST4